MHMKKFSAFGTTELVNAPERHMPTLLAVFAKVNLL
jgi:hypothetical protein